MIGWWLDSKLSYFNILQEIMNLIFLTELNEMNHNNNKQQPRHYEIKNINCYTKKVANLEER